jgi:hypothetical protein
MKPSQTSKSMAANVIQLGQGSLRARNRLQLQCKPPRGRYGSVVVAHGNAAPVFEPAEHDFYAPAWLVGAPVVNGVSDPF